MELAPTPLYPPLINRPLTLANNDEYKYQITLKQKFRNRMIESPYFILSNTSEKFNYNSTIERYSDKYSKKKKTADEWDTDWTRLPSELKYFYEKDIKAKEKKSLKRTKKAQQSKKNAKKIDLKKIIDQNIDIKNEGEENDDENENTKNDEDDEEDEDDEKKSKKNNESENEEGENDDEEDIEEENDYIDTYFDNGENYDDDMGGGGDDDGPVY